jgi:ribosomal protein S17E
MVKKAAKQLLASELGFNESFEQNKKILSSTMPSKPIRNKIAGYMARLKKMEKKPKKVKAAAAEPNKTGESQ